MNDFYMANWQRLGKVGPVAGRRLCQAHGGQCLHHRRARLWLAGHHHQSHRDHRRLRPTARRVHANAYSGRAEGGYRFVTPWIGGVGITPYAAGQFTTFDLPAYAESAISGTSAFALNYAAKSVTDTRSELGIRTDKSFAMTNSILTPAQPFCLGA
jgi:hypothetical protein